MRGRPLIVVISITLLACCKESAPPAPAEAVQKSALPSILVKVKRSKLLYTYADDKGGFSTVEDLQKVPEDRRGWVRVVDLNLKPDLRRDHELVYVADLRTARPDGSYPYVVMSRAAFEAAAVGRPLGGATDTPQATQGKPPSGSSQKEKVILYATSWCPACRTAREYLREKGIPFIERDIEKDARAAEELLQKAKAAGISASGVPVLEVNGTLMQGFDAQRLHELLGEKR